jgi:hypothetical protein
MPIKSCTLSVYRTVTTASIEFSSLTPSIDLEMSMMMMIFLPPDTPEEYHGLMRGS